MPLFNPTTSFLLQRRHFLHGLMASAVAPVLILQTRDARAELQFDLRPGAFKPMPIAIADFAGEGDQGAKVAQVIFNNLKRSGYFAPLPKDKFPENPAADAVPNFSAWQATGAQALVTGRVVKDGGRLRTEFRLWEIGTGQQVAGQQLATDAANWRRVSHLVSDAVWEKIIGEKGHFDTRVVFVDESGPKEQRRKRLAIMDQDGANVRYLTSGADLVVTPRFSPNSQSIAYMAFSQGGDARVFVHQLETNQREAVGNFQGMSFSPRFSPQGNKLVMSLQQGGASNIYTYDLGARSTAQLTDGTSINTSPSYSPDGSQIVFESDRGGQQQVYVMSASGGAAKRISFGDGSYSTPVWSPRGDLIAFTKRKGGNFAIGIMKTDGSGERILTEGFHNEGPTFSPNGRFLMFFRDPGGNAGAKIYMVDITGRVELVVPTPNFASDPAWGPRLSG